MFFVVWFFQLMFPVLMATGSTQPPPQTIHCQSGQPANGDCSLAWEIDTESTWTCSCAPGYLMDNPRDAQRKCSRRQGSIRFHPETIPKCSRLMSIDQTLSSTYSQSWDHPVFREQGADDCLLDDIRLDFSRDRNTLLPTIHQIHVWSESIEHEDEPPTLWINTVHASDVMIPAHHSEGSEHVFLVDETVNIIHVEGECLRRLAITLVWNKTNNGDTNRTDQCGRPDLIGEGVVAKEVEGSALGKNAHLRPSKSMEVLCREGYAPSGYIQRYRLNCVGRERWTSDLHGSFGCTKDKRLLTNDSKNSGVGNGERMWWEENLKILLVMGSACGVFAGLTLTMVSFWERRRRRNWQSTNSHNAVAKQFKWETESFGKFGSSQKQMKSMMLTIEEHQGLPVMKENPQGLTISLPTSAPALASLMFFKRKRRKLLQNPIRQLPWRRQASKSQSESNSESRSRGTKSSSVSTSSSSPRKSSTQPSNHESRKSPSNT